MKPRRFVPLSCQSVKKVEPIEKLLQLWSSDEQSVQSGHISQVFSQSVVESYSHRKVESKGDKYDQLTESDLEFDQEILKELKKDKPKQSTELVPLSTSVYDSHFEEATLHRSKPHNKKKRRRKMRGATIDTQSDSCQGTQNKANDDSSVSSLSLGIFFGGQAHETLESDKNDPEVLYFERPNRIQSIDLTWTQEIVYDFPFDSTGSPTLDCDLENNETKSGYYSPLSSLSEKPATSKKSTADLHADQIENEVFDPSLTEVITKYESQTTLQEEIMSELPDTPNQKSPKRVLPSHFYCHLHPIPVAQATKSIAQYPTHPQVIFIQ